MRQDDKQGDHISLLNKTTLVFINQVAQWCKNPPAKSGDARDTGWIPG